MSARLLSDPLPLRPAAALPAYRADAGNQFLPWVYGRATLTPVPLSADSLEWLVADHPIVAVERVTIGSNATDGWQLTQRLDETGAAISVLRLTQAPQSGQALAVTVLGRRHPETGAALEHPADIAADLLRQCGWSVSADAFQGLRDDYPTLTLGCVIDSPQSLRETLASIIEPLGAVWQITPPTARRHQSGSVRARLDLTTADDISARTDASHLATVAHVRYAHDWAAGAARGALTLEAPDAIAQYGRIEITLDLPAVRTARDALACGTARLQDLARPRWSCDATVPARLALLPGDTVALAHPRVPSGAALVMSTAHDRSRDSLQLTVVMPAGPAPRIEMAQRSTAVDATTAQNGVTFRDGIATFTVTDDTGAPLAGATVTLDGQDTRETDRSGQVQFRTTRGAHTLSVYAAGYAPFTLDVVV